VRPDRRKNLSPTDATVKVSAFGGLFLFFMVLESLPQKLEFNFPTELIRGGKT